MSKQRRKPGRPKGASNKPNYIFESNDFGLYHKKIFIHAMKHTQYLLFLILVLLNTNCSNGGDNGGVTPSTPILSNGVSLNESAITLKIGETYQLVATVSPSNTDNKTVTWSIGDSDVATVKSGLVTAISSGNTYATVTAVSGGQSATCSVSVSPAEVAVTRIDIQPSSVSINKGKSITVQAVVTPSDATNKEIECHIDDNTVASFALSEDKVSITGLKDGSTNLTVKSKQYPNISSSCRISVVTGKGYFSVSPTKLVKFAPGNLYWNGNEFKFEEKQYNYPNYWNLEHIGNFYWAQVASSAYAKDYNEDEETCNDILFTNKTETTPNPNFKVDGSKGVWRTLSGGADGEWIYLLESRKCTTSGMDSVSVRCARVTVNKVEGLLLFPDVFTWTSEMGTPPKYVNNKSSWTIHNYSVAEFEVMEAFGCVFLPKTHIRHGWIVDSENSCYWSSTLYYTGDSYQYFNAYNIRFSGIYFSPNDKSGRNNGFPIRLVRE